LKLKGFSPELQTADGPISPHPPPKPRQLLTPPMPGQAALAGEH
jgi:hypothetical protein